MEATRELQQGRPGYYALWNHILQVSVADLKKNYERLNVTFDLWKKESDAQPYIPELVAYLKEKGYARLDQGALVVDVKEEDVSLQYHGSGHHCGEDEIVSSG